LLAYLNEIPSLLIVDDIDTVMDQTDVAEFFTFYVPAKKSKLLLTSRRDIPGIRTLVVEVFNIEETIRICEVPMPIRTRDVLLNSLRIHPMNFDASRWTTKPSPERCRAQRAAKLPR
jgi:hypothetical protein